MPSLTRIVQTMVKKELVTRETRTDDRRRQTVQITNKGKRIIEDNLAEAAAIAKRFEKLLGKQQLASLLATLKELDNL